jgi:hypothetical protein
MKDPTPYLNATELERQLLEAARQDTVPAALKLRMAEALVVSQPSAAAQAAPPTVARGPAAGVSRGGLLFSHPAIWGSLSALIVAGAVSWQAVSHSERVIAQRRAPARTQPSAAAPAPAVERTPEEQSNAVRPVGATLGAPVSAENTASSMAGAAADRGGSPARAGMREELELLDAARAALASRETVRALHLLDRHAERFARGRLAPEADALRIDALMQSGASDRARRLSRRFLERHPTHPLAAHISEIAQLR